MPAEQGSFGVQQSGQEGSGFSENQQLYMRENSLIDQLAKCNKMSVVGLSDISGMPVEQVSELLAVPYLSSQLVVFPNNADLLYRLRQREDLIHKSERMEANTIIKEVAGTFAAHPHATVDLLQHETKRHRYQIWYSLHQLIEYGWIAPDQDSRAWMYRDLWAESIEPQLEQHRKKLYHNALQRVADFDFADEIVQQVYIEAYHCRYSLKPHSDLLPWFRRVEYALMYDQMTRVSPVAFSDMGITFMDNEDTPYIETIPDEHPAPDEIAQQREELAAILDRLPPHLKQVVLLRYHHGLKLSEVGKAIHKSQRMAQTYLTQAQVLMEQARQELGNEMLEQPLGEE